MVDIKVGEVWRLTHSRKGDLTLKFTSVDDEWATGTIIQGRVRYMSDQNRLAQRFEGQGTPGDTITARISFLTLHERLEPACTVSSPNQPLPPQQSGDTRR